MSIPLAWLAGVLSILSPCVWPLVPVVMTSAATAGRTGPWMLGLGLSTSFALAGTVLTFALLNMGISTEVLRYVAAVLLLAIAATLLIPALANAMTTGLGRLTARMPAGAGGHGGASSQAGQFGLGMLLGLVWLPCVGPTLGAAIGLASMGQSMGMAAVVMFTFGVGTAMTLLLAGTVSRHALNRWRPTLMSRAGRIRQVLGATLLLLGVMVLTGVDKVLETWALQVLPDWAIML